MRYNASLKRLTRIRNQHTMLTRVKNTALAASLLLASTAHAEIEEDGRYWLNISLLGNLPANDWNWTLDLRPRWRDEGRNFDQFIASGYINKNLGPKLSLGLGVDHVFRDGCERSAQHQCVKSW